jgi:hypothetical protein
VGKFEAKAARFRERATVLLKEAETAETAAGREAYGKLAALWLSLADAIEAGSLSEDHTDS